MDKRVLLCLMMFLITACTLSAPKIEVTPTNSPNFTPEWTMVGTESPMVEKPEIVEPFVTDTVSPTIEAQPQILPKPTPTTTAELTAEDRFPFQVQAGTPVGTANFVEPNAGCNWLGVGGQVFESTERPVSGMIVEVSGVLMGEPVLLLALTGSNTALGPGGYQIKLADQPVESSGSLWIQLYDLNGNPKSDKVYFDTYGGEDACDRNLIVINFAQVGSIARDYFFPGMYKEGRGTTP